MLLGGDLDSYSVLYNLPAVNVATALAHADNLFPFALGVCNVEDHELDLEPGDCT